MTDQLDPTLKLIIENIEILNGKADALVSFCTGVAQTLPKDPNTISCFSMLCESLRPDESKVAAAGSFDTCAQLLLTAMNAPANPLPPIVPSPLR